MTIEHQKETTQNGSGTTTVGQAVEAGLHRMKTAWPAHAWRPEGIAEYRRVLNRAERPQDVEAAVTRAIDETESRYPPPVATVARILREIPPPRPEPKAYTPDLGVDEGALRDAINALSCSRDEDADQLEDAIRGIRRRLPDKGARVDRLLASEVTFTRGRSHRDDPPGTVRLRRKNAPLPAEHQFPRGPLNGGAAAVIAATLATLTAMGLAA